MKKKKTEKRVRAFFENGTHGRWGKRGKGGQNMGEKKTELEKKKRSKIKKGQQGKIPRIEASGNFTSYPEHVNKRNP